RAHRPWLACAGTHGSPRRSAKPCSQLSRELVDELAGGDPPPRHRVRLVEWRQRGGGPCLQPRRRGAVDGRQPGRLARVGSHTVWLRRRTAVAAATKTRLIDPWPDPSLPSSAGRTSVNRPFSTASSVGGRPSSTRRP